MPREEPSYLTERLNHWRARTDGLMLVLAIGTLPFLLLEIERNELPSSDRWLIDAVNVVVLVAFAIDYVVELVLASDRRAYARHEWTSLLIVVTQAGAILPYLGPLGLLRALRGVRGLRAAAALARLLAIGGAAAAESRTYLRRNAGRIALGAAGLTWLSSAAAFTLAEDVGEGADSARSSTRSGGQQRRSQLLDTATSSRSRPLDASSAA